VINAAHGVSTPGQAQLLQPSQKANRRGPHGTFTIVRPGESPPSIVRVSGLQRVRLASRTFDTPQQKQWHSWEMGLVHRATLRVNPQSGNGPRRLDSRRGRVRQPTQFPLPRVRHEDVPPSISNEGNRQRKRVGHACSLPYCCQVVRTTESTQEVTRALHSPPYCRETATLLQPVVALTRSAASNQHASVIVDTHPPRAATRTPSLTTVLTSPSSAATWLYGVTHTLVLLDATESCVPQTSGVVQCAVAAPTTCATVRGDDSRWAGHRG
jgi:hypothetical protein